MCCRTTSWTRAQRSFGDAFEAVNRLESTRSKITLLTNLALAQSIGGCEHLAQKTFATAIELAQSNKEQYDKLFDLLVIAVAQSKTYSRAEACITFEAARNMAYTAQDGKWLMEVAVKLAETGFGNEALEIAQTISKSKDILHLAAVFADRCELVNFKRALLLVPLDLEIAGKMCLLLARAIPDQATELAVIIDKFYPSETNKIIPFATDSNNVLDFFNF
jgi:hypothetical protein